MKLDIKLPNILEVDDYHEFEYVESLFKHIIPGLQIDEVGFYDGKYAGVAYLKNTKSTSEVKAVIDQIKKDEKDWQKENGYD